MNTLCPTCKHVDLLGHHKCRWDGDVVAITKSVLDKTLLKRAEAMARDLNPSIGGKRMVDSISRKDILRARAILNGSSIDPHQTLILGDDYYGIPQYQHYAPTRPMYFQPKSQAQKREEMFDDMIADQFWGESTDGMITSLYFNSVNKWIAKLLDNGVVPHYIPKPNGDPYEGEINVPVKKKHAIKRYLKWFKKEKKYGK